MMVDRLLALGEAALVGGLGLLLAGREIAFLFLALRVVLVVSCPVAKEPWCPCSWSSAAGTPSGS